MKHSAPPIPACHIPGSSRDAIDTRNELLELRSPAQIATSECTSSTVSGEGLSDGAQEQQHFLQRFPVARGMSQGCNEAGCGRRRHARAEGTATTCAAPLLKQEQGVD